MGALATTVPVARLMLLHNKRRLALSVSAMTFTVMIMFVELGFFNGINDSQSRLPPMFDADLVMMDQRSVHLNKYNRMDRIRLFRALEFGEVTEVVPIYKENVGLKNRQTKLTKVIFALAFPADAHPFKIADPEAAAAALKKTGTVLFDRKSREIFGTIQAGQDIDINGRLLRVGGFVEMGPNFSIDGTILMSDATWLQNPWAGSADRISYGLIRTRAGSDIQALKHKLLAVLPKDIIVLTPEEMRRREVLYTIKAVPLGAIFGVGMVIGFIIGVIICYQILYNEITDHLPQYATLRAMGFADGFLKHLVVRQALWLCFFGFVPGWLGAVLIYRAIEHFTGILMFFTVGRVLLVLVVTLCMCAVAGLIAVKKVTSADPAELF